MDERFAGQIHHHLHLRHLGLPSARDGGVSVHDAYPIAIPRVTPGPREHDAFSAGIHEIPHEPPPDEPGSAGQEDAH
jgi:hypothetical protein